MSSSKLPQTGLIATSSFIFGIHQIVGLMLIAFISAYFLYDYIKKYND